MENNFTQNADNIGQRGDSNYDARTAYFEVMKYFMDEQHAPVSPQADTLIDEYMRYEKHVSQYLQTLITHHAK